MPIERQSLLDRIRRAVARAAVTVLTGPRQSGRQSSESLAGRMERLERVAVVYPGAQRYPLHERVEVVPLATLAERGKLFAGT